MATVCTHERRGSGERRLLKPTAGCVYPKLEDTVVVVTRPLARLGADPARLRTLAGWDWINAATEPLHTS
jgi:hypothetical protein